MTEPVPPDWIVSRLGTCCNIISGGTPRRDRPEYWGGSIPWVTPKDVSNLDGPDFFEPAERITELGLRKSSAALLPAGAILLSSRAPIGLLAIAGRPMATNQGFKSLVPGPELDGRFLYYAIRRLVPLIQERGNGATFKEVSKSVVSEIPVSYPRSLEQQRRIAAILDKAVSVDKKRSQIAEEADALLRATFLDMFGHPAALIGEYPLLSDVADVSRGRFSPRPRNDPTYYNGEFPFIQTGEIAAADGYLSDFRQTLNRRGIKVSKKFPPATVFIAIVGATIGATAISTRDFWCPDSVIGIVPKSKSVPSEFLEYLLRFWKPIFLEKAPETARANINLQTLRPISIPGIGTNKPLEFARIYEAVHRIKSQLHSKRQDLLPSVMQRAFSGDL
jgi:type I restriction enzyme S subunit